MGRAFIVAGASACPASRAAAGTPHKKSRSRISEGPCRAIHLTAKELCAHLGALATSTVRGAAVDAENSVVGAGKPANSVPASTAQPERKVMCPRASRRPLCFVFSHPYVFSPRLFFKFGPSFETPIAVDALVLGGHRLQRYQRI